MGCPLTVTTTSPLLLLCERNKHDTEMNKHLCVPVQLCLWKQPVGWTWPLSCGFPTPDLEGKINIYQIIGQIICNAKLVNCKTSLGLRATDEKSLWLSAWTINQFYGGKKRAVKPFLGEGQPSWHWNDGVEVSLMKRQLREEHGRQREEHMPKPCSAEVF